MTRILLLLLMMSVSTLGFAQDNNRNEELEKSLQKLKSENRILRNRVSELESSLFSVQNTVNQSKEEIKIEIRKSQELQAQNERAMNISLDEFSKKFEGRHSYFLYLEQEETNKNKNLEIYVKNEDYQSPPPAPRYRSNKFNKYLSVNNIPNKYHVSINQNK